MPQVRVDNWERIYGEIPLRIYREVPLRNMAPLKEENYVAQLDNIWRQRYDQNHHEDFYQPKPRIVNPQESPKLIWSTNKEVIGGLVYEVGRNKEGIIISYKEIPPKIEECF